MSLKVGIVWLLVGLALLALGSRILVGGAVYIATSLGVSEMIIDEVCEWVVDEHDTL